LLLLGLNRAARPAELIEQPRSFLPFCPLALEIIGGLLRQQMDNVQISLVGPLPRAVVHRKHAEGVAARCWRTPVSTR